MPVAKPPGGVRLLMVEPTTDTALAPMLELIAGERPVRWELAELELADGERVVVAGSGPELGAWSPAEAPPATEATPLPIGGVFAYKLVVHGADGVARWEQGENRHLWVEPGDAPLVVEARWRGAE